MIARIPQYLLATALFAGYTIASPIASPIGDSANLCKKQEPGNCTLQLGLSTYDGDSAVQSAWIWDNDCMRIRTYPILHKGNLELCIDTNLNDSIGNMIGSSDNDTNAATNVIRWSCGNDGCSLDSQLSCTVDIYPSWTTETIWYYDTSYMEYAGISSAKGMVEEGPYMSNGADIIEGCKYNRLISFDCTGTC